jgi:hypothetical protein
VGLTKDDKAVCPLVVRPSGPRPPGGFTIPASPDTASLRGGSQSIRQQRSGAPSWYSTMAFHGAYAGTEQGVPRAFQYVWVFTIALRIVRNLRMAAVIATFCDFPRASSRW